MSDSQETSTEEAPVPTTSAEVEHRWHSYLGSRIPWYVRFIWLMYWVFAVYYTITFLFPALQIEIVSPP